MAIGLLRSEPRDDPGPVSAADPHRKILSREQVLRDFGPPRSGRLVFTNGVFDLLHAGHVACLAAAADFGDTLLVAVNSDASVRALRKGPGRPFNVEGDRALIIAGLESVDAVCLFEEETPAELIAALVPDVLVKGGDYRPDEVVGADLVEQTGGRVEIIPLLEGQSTSDLVRRIGEAES